MDLPVSVGFIFRFFPSPSSGQALAGCVSEGEQWCWGEFLLRAGGTRAQTGVARRDFTLTEVTNCVILCYMP